VQKIVERDGMGKATDFAAAVELDVDLPTLMQVCTHISRSQLTRFDRLGSTDTLRLTRHNWQAAARSAQLTHTPRAPMIVRMAPQDRSGAFHIVKQLRVGFGMSPSWVNKNKRWLSTQRPLAAARGEDALFYDNITIVCLDGGSGLHW
jgi:hypothetical protein